MWDLFRLCPQYVMLPPLQSTCLYIVNHNVKIWHVHLGGANNMHPLSWGGAQTEKIPDVIKLSVLGTDSDDPVYFLYLCSSEVLSASHVTL